MNFGRAETAYRLDNVIVPGVLNKQLTSLSTQRDSYSQNEYNENLFVQNITNIVHSLSKLIQKETCEEILKALELTGLSFPEYCEGHFNDTSSELEDMSAPNIWLSSLFPLSLTIRDKIQSTVIPKLSFGNYRKRKSSKRKPRKRV